MLDHAFDPEPKVTVLMTVYNGTAYLAEAIESILGQSFGDFEFLIIDDASTDGSRDVVYSYNDHRIRLIQNEANLGQVRSLNRGLHLARGEYIARLDQDDVALPHRLERQMGYLAEHPDVVLLGTWCQFIDETGDQVGHFHPPLSHHEIVEACATMCPFAHSSAVFQREAVHAMGDYPSDYRRAMDFALWLQLCRRHQVANLPEELVQIRLHQGQVSLSADMRTVRAWDALRLCRTALTLPDLSPQARQAGRRMVVSATLRYAELLSLEGRRRAALRWLGNFCLRYPHLSARDYAASLLRVVLVLLGPRAWEMARSIKHSLGDILPMRRYHHL